MRPEKMVNEGPYDLCFTPNIIRVLTKGKLPWVVHVARLRQKRCSHKFYG